MNKRHVVMIASLSGIFGIMMGVLVASWAWLNSGAAFASSGAIARAEAGIAKKMELLGQLRSGRYADATRQVQAWLDADVARAAEYTGDGAELSAATLRAVEAERRTRGAPGFEPANASGGGAPSETYGLSPSSEMAARATPIVSHDDVR